MLAYQAEKQTRKQTQREFERAREQRLALQQKLAQERQRLLDTARPLLPMLADASISQATGLDVALIQQLRRIK